MSENERESAPVQGIFDKKEPSATVADQDQITGTATEKKDFKDPFKMRQEEEQRKAKRASSPNPTSGDDYASSAASAINSAAGGGRDIMSELDEMESVSERDLELAEQMVFKGYAEFDAEMTNLPNHKFTICSTSVEEMKIIDEIIFEVLKDAENEDGTIDLPQNHVQSLRNSLYIAMSYRGRNKQELMEDSNCSLNTIKQAIARMSEMQSFGKIKEADEIKTVLKKNLKKRALSVDKMAHPLIDFLSLEKQKFDSKMLKIMSSKGLLPKY